MRCLPVSAQQQGGTAYPTAILFLIVDNLAAFALKGHDIPAQGRRPCPKRNPTIPAPSLGLVCGRPYTATKPIGKARYVRLPVLDHQLSIEHRAKLITRSQQIWNFSTGLLSSHSLVGMGWAERWGIGTELRTRRKSWYRFRTSELARSELLFNILRDG